MPNIPLQTLSSPILFEGVVTVSNASLNEFKTQLADYDARHGAAIFLTLLALVGLDIMSIDNEKQRQKATATWLAWGIPFFLLASFFITPEQDAMAIRRRMNR